MYQQAVDHAPYSFMFQMVNSVAKKIINYHDNKPNEKGYMAHAYCTMLLHVFLFLIFLPHPFLMLRCFP